MDSKKQVAFAIADAFLAREANPHGLMKSATWVLGKKWPWIPAMCQKIHARTGAHFYHFSRRELAEFILADHGFCMAWQGDAAAPTIKHYCLEAPIATEKPEWLSALSLPELRSTAELANWLRLPLGELAWFANQWRVDARRASALQHYRYR